MATNIASIHINIALLSKLLVMRQFLHLYSKRLFLMLLLLYQHRQALLMRLWFQIAHHNLSRLQRLITPQIAIQFICLKIIGLAWLHLFAVLPR